MMRIAYRYYHAIFFFIHENMHGLVLPMQNFQRNVYDKFTFQLYDE
jgi:hypothetical protein